MVQYKNSHIVNILLQLTFLINISCMYYYWLCALLLFYFLHLYNAQFYKNSTKLTHCVLILTYLHENFLLKELVLYKLFLLPILDRPYHKRRCKLHVTASLL